MQGRRNGREDRVLIPKKIVSTNITWRNMICIHVFLVSECVTGSIYPMSGRLVQGSLGKHEELPQDNEVARQARQGSRTRQWYEGLMLLENGAKIAVHLIFVSLSLF